MHDEYSKVLVIIINILGTGKRKRRRKEQHDRKENESGWRWCTGYSRQGGWQLGEKKKETEEEGDENLTGLDLVENVRESQQPSEIWVEARNEGKTERIFKAEGKPR